MDVLVTKVFLLLVNARRKTFSLHPSRTSVRVEILYNPAFRIHPGNFIDNSLSFLNLIISDEAYGELFQDVDSLHLMLVVILVIAFHRLRQPLGCRWIDVSQIELFAQLIAIFGRESTPTIGSFLTAFSCLHGPTHLLLISPKIPFASLSVLKP